MKTRTAAAIVAAATLAIYWRALGAGFVGDDFMILHRLRALAGPADVLHFFRGEFFELPYRPVGFVLQALDWAIAGPDPWQFHLTNLLLHTISAALVLLIGRALSPGSIAGPLAALLFALHASNHEAVVWISARFDLAATCCSLAAVWLMVRGGRASTGLAPLLFLVAVLSKESAVALPVAAAAFAVFQLEAGTAETAWRTVPWLAALAVYSLLRDQAGGVSAIGGATRIPKLVAFAVLLGAVVALAGGRWLRVRGWLLQHRGAAIAALAALLVAAVLTAQAGGWRSEAGRLAADKLAVAGFAIFHLVSPVLDVLQVPFYLQPGTRMYWLGGAVAVAAMLALLAALWRPLLDDKRNWFLGALLAAALLPISALTEGARYLYLPSAALSLITGEIVASLRGRARAAAVTVLAIVLLLSTAQIAMKVRDWNWAGRMTADGAAMVDAALAPSCGEGRVVFLTEPVAIRSVYTHFYYETFEPPRGCMPALFQILIRVLRLDSVVDARWDGPSRIVITAPQYRDNFSLSRDLREFNPPVRDTAPIDMITPLGRLRGQREGDALRLTLDLLPGVAGDQTHFFYYSAGQMRALAK